MLTQDNARHIVGTAGTYPANDYSNKRWCCGDMDHFDVSVWAFEKLADKKWGVIGIKYRRGELRPVQTAIFIS